MGEGELASSAEASATSASSNAADAIGDGTDGSAEGADAELGGEENGPPQKRARGESAEAQADSGAPTVDCIGVSNVTAGKRAATAIGHATAESSAHVVELLRGCDS